jgi:hypothetical protein
MSVEQGDFIIEMFAFGLMLISFYSGIKLGYSK